MPVFYTKFLLLLSAICNERHVTYQPHRTCEVIHSPMTRLVTVRGHRCVCSTGSLPSEWKLLDVDHPIITINYHYLSDGVHLYT